LRKHVRESLIPNLDEWRRDKESEYSNYDSPEDHMEPHLDSLKLLKKTFRQIKFTSHIDKQIHSINKWISDAEAERPEEINPRKKLETSDVNEVFKETRSIFDDVDE
jgi:hypothetical protein